MIGSETRGVAFPWARVVAEMADSEVIDLTDESDNVKKIIQNPDANINEFETIAIPFICNLSHIFCKNREYVAHWLKFLEHIDTNKHIRLFWKTVAQQMYYCVAWYVCLLIE